MSQQDNSVTREFAGSSLQGFVGLALIAIWIVMVSGTLYT